MKHLQSRFFFNIEYEICGACLRDSSLRVPQILLAH